LFKDTDDLDEGDDSASESESGCVDQSGAKAKRTRAKKGTDKRNDKPKGKSSKKDTNQTKAKTSTDQEVFPFLEFFVLGSSYLFLAGKRRVD
jgi:hypothetical protein